MYPEIYSIALEFGILPQNIVRCKYFFIIYTDKFTYSLSKARINSNKIMEIYRLKEQLFAYGFHSLDRFLLSKSNLPYVEREGELYTLCRYLGCNELDFLNNQQVAKAVEAIAQLENRISLITEEPLVQVANIQFSLLQQMEKGIRTMEKSRHIISNCKNMKPWDRAVVKIYDKYYTRARNSLDFLRTQSLSTTYIHNRLKEGNILYNRGKIRIIDWDYMKMGCFLWDLAFFINRYVRKNAFYADKNGYEYLSLEDILELYNNFNPLSDNEIKQLKAMLAFPQQFISILEEIYKKSRAFIPAGLDHKLQEAVEQVDFPYIK